MTPAPVVKTVVVVEDQEDSRLMMKLLLESHGIIVHTAGDGQEGLELIDRVKKNPKLMLAPVLSGSFWLEFVGFQDPNSPFHDKRVRQAISLAIDRKAINEAESGGLGKVSGNWINDDVQYGLPWPELEFNLAKARALMKEAGHPNGFTVNWLTPLAPFYSRGERVVAQLQAIGAAPTLKH